MRMGNPTKIHRTAGVWMPRPTHASDVWLTGGDAEVGAQVRWQRITHETNIFAA
jgi:hypothetical protein